MLLIDKLVVWIEDLFGSLKNYENSYMKFFLWAMVISVASKMLKVKVDVKKA